MVIPEAHVVAQFRTVMQKTDGLLGPALFHAGADIPVILGIFSNL